MEIQAGALDWAVNDEQNWASFLNTETGRRFLPRAPVVGQRRDKRDINSHWHRARFSIGRAGNVPHGANTTPGQHTGRELSSVGKRFGLVRWTKNGPRTSEAKRSRT